MSASCSTLDLKSVQLVEIGKDDEADAPILAHGRLEAIAI